MNSLLHMRVSSLTTGFLTFPTFIIIHTSINSPTYIKVWMISKSHPTFLAFKELFTNINTLFSSNLFLHINGFSIFITFIGLSWVFFNNIHNLMLNKLSTHSKNFIKFLIFIKLFSSMNSLYYNNDWFKSKYIPTFLTLIRYLTSMNSLDWVTCPHTIKAVPHSLHS